MTFEVPTEHMFSFNNPIGACPVCEGYGKVVGIDEELVVPDKTRSIYDDAIAAWRGDTMKWWKEQLVASAHKFDFPIHSPTTNLTREQKQVAVDGKPLFQRAERFLRIPRKANATRYSIGYCSPDIRARRFAMNAAGAGSVRRRFTSK